MNRTTGVAGMLGLALVVPLAAACSNDGGDAPQAQSQSTAAPSRTSEAPSTGLRSTTPVPPPAATSTAPTGTDLPDGVHVGRILRISPAAGSVTVDIVQFLTGDAAARAAAEDNAEVPPPNDYYIRNADPRLRTLSVASGAPITVNVHGAQESGSATTNIPKTLTELAGIEGIEDGLFRLTLEDGQVIRLAEMYLP
jgi:hypothetical protein